MRHDRVMAFVAVFFLSLAVQNVPADPNREERLKAIAAERAEDDRRRANDPCLRRVGDDWEIVRWRDCLKLGPPKRMRGVWYYGFEESGFVPNVRTVPLSRSLDGNSREFDTVLDIDLEQVRRVRSVELGLPCTTAIAINFVGREATIPTSGGVLPTAKRVIGVDQVLDVRLVGIVRTVGRPRQCPKRIN